MSIVFFLFVFALFLFFFGSFVCSPEKNPRFVKVMESEHAPSKETLAIVVGFCYAVGASIGVGLVIVVPFFRALAAIVMTGLVVRFFYRRHFGTGKANGSPLGVNMHDDPRNATSAGDESPGTGGGTSH